MRWSPWLRPCKGGVNLAVLHWPQKSPRRSSRSCPAPCQKPLHGGHRLPDVFRDVVAYQHPPTLSASAASRPAWRLQLSCRSPFLFAYGVMSIPAGFLVERFGEKTAMIAAFLVGTAGSLSFGLHPGYRVAVFLLFVMGSGMATLQTAINPLLRVSGGEAHFAFNSAFAHLVLRKRLVSQCVYVFIFGPEPG